MHPKTVIEQYTGKTVYKRHMLLGFQYGYFEIIKPYRLEESVKAGWFTLVDEKENTPFSTHSSDVILELPENLVYNRFHEGYIKLELVKQAFKLMLGFSQLKDNKFKSLVRFKTSVKKARGFFIDLPHKTPAIFVDQLGELYECHILGNVPGKRTKVRIEVFLGPFKQRLNIESSRIFLNEAEARNYSPES